MAKKHNDREKFFFNKWLREQNLIYGIEGRLPFCNSDSKAAGPVYGHDGLMLSESFTVPEAFDLSLLKGEVIADILRIWDADAQKWANDGPIIVRLECDDVTLWMDEDSRINPYLGAVRTELPILAFQDDAAKDLGKLNPALGWLSDERYSFLFGNTIDRADSFNTNDSAALSLFAFDLDSGYSLEIFSSKRRPALDITIHMYPSGLDKAMRNE